MNPPDLFDVSVDRLIAAPPERVFRAWTDTDLLEKWFGAVQLSIDPRVGGLLFIEVDFEGRLWSHFGRYLAVDAPHTLTFTWMSEATLGIETTVELELTAVGHNQTQLRLTHTGVPNTERAPDNKAGWKECLANVARFVENLA